MCTQLQVVLHHLGVTSTPFWCKLTRIPRLHNTVLVFFYPIQIRIVSGLHYCGVNVHHVGVTFTLNWCSHSCKNLHFFGVTITLSLFLCFSTMITWQGIFPVFLVQRQNWQKPGLRRLRRNSAQYLLNKYHARVPLEMVY